MRTSLLSCLAGVIALSATAPSAITAALAAAPVPVPKTDEAADLEALLRDIQRTEDVARALKVRDAAQLFAAQFSDLRDQAKNDPALLKLVDDIQSGRFQSVDQAATALIGNHPRKAFLFELRGIAKTYGGDRDGALADFSQSAALGAAAATGSHAVTARQTAASALTRKGIVLSAMGQHDAAIAALKDALRTDPATTRAQQELGLIYYLRGRYTEAVGQLAPLAPSAPSAVTLLTVALADAAHRAQDHQTVQAALTPFTADALSPYLLLLRGSAALLRGDYPTAQNDYTALLARDPTRPQYRLLLAKALARTGKLDEAMATLDDPQTDQSAVTDAYAAERVLLRLAAGNVAAARAVSAPLLAAERPPKVAIGAAIALFLAEEDTPGALRWLDQLITRHPSATAHEHRASLHASQGRYPDAVTDFAAASTLAPQDTAILRQLALAATRADMPDQTLTAASALVALAPTASSFAFAGAVAEDAGDPLQAERYYRQALSTGGSFLATHNLAVLLARQGQFAKARPLAERALEERPQLGPVQHNWGWILANSGALAEARPFLETAAHTNGTDPVLWLRLALVRGALGDADAAAQARDKAHTLDPGSTANAGITDLMSN